MVDEVCMMVAGKLVKFLFPNLESHAHSSSPEIEVGSVRHPPENCITVASVE